MDINDARKLVLEFIERSADDRGPFSSGGVTVNGLINYVEQQSRGGQSNQQLILTAWFDLFRTGVLSYGLDFANPGMQWARLTDHGKKTLQQVSRDPANPKGYMALLAPILPAGSIARSYIEEGLHTYNAGCDKATAVMVGAAAEAIGLDLRDTLVGKMKALGKAVPKQLEAWQIKTVLDAIEAELEPQTKKMPQDLRERFSSFWSAFTGQLRISRNEAGHPKSVDPVTRDVVHSSLLIFPELARLARDLDAWVQSSYT
jgi:hypothetical protein